MRTRLNLSNLLVVITLTGPFIIAHAQQNIEPHVTEVFFEDFNSELDNDVWHIATWREHGGQTGPERCFAEDGMLNLVFLNSSTDGYLNASINTREEFLYGKWEARLKPSKVPGILNSFFTIDWNNTTDEARYDNGTKQEVDIEFLTYTFEQSAGEVHYAVHEQNKTSFNTNPDIPVNFNPSDDFHVWGFEITPEKIEWFVDNQVLQTYVYSENDIHIDAPYQLKLNTWTSENWINGPPAENTECVYLIDWIKFTPYEETSAMAGRTTTTETSSVYPTRFTNELTIEYTLERAQEICAEIYNSQGRKVRTTNKVYVESGRQTLIFDTGDFDPGIYLVKIHTQNGIETRKCVRIN